MRFLPLTLRLTRCPTLSAPLKRLTYHSLGTEGKAFLLSLIENAVNISHGKIMGREIGQIIELGKELLRLPGHPFDGVKATLAKLRETGRYRMVVFTKVNCSTRRTNSGVRDCVPTSTILSL